MLVSPRLSSIMGTLFADITHLAVCNICYNHGKAPQREISDDARNTTAPNNGLQSTAAAGSDS